MKKRRKLENLMHKFVNYLKKMKFYKMHSVNKKPKERLYHLKQILKLQKREEVDIQ